VSAALLLAAGLVLPAGALPAGTAPRAAVVVAAIENMYAAGDEDAEVVSQATLGEVVEVLEASGPFARVRTPDGYEGWLPRSALAEYADPAAPRYARAGRVVAVTSLMANVYREPDVTTARPKTVAPLATRLEVAGDGPGARWLAVRLPAGDTGYVQTGDVKPVDPAAPPRRGTREDLVATARRFLGVPYLWGGMTARGIDCSGFVSRVYHANGVLLPRDADLQFQDPNAAPVERGALLPGDLVFFGGGAKGITHVGLYLGHGRFIDATTHGTPVVREDRLDDPHWSSTYQGARRPR
jgi:gamma-D-glutamyl-L-lysine dipeptidyl-peptidase